jgi:hypothetical protein
MVKEERLALSFLSERDNSIFINTKAQSKQRVILNLCLLCAFVFIKINFVYAVNCLESLPKFPQQCVQLSVRQQPLPLHPSSTLRRFDSPLP